MAKNNNNNRRRRQRQADASFPVAFSPKLGRNLPSVGKISVGKDLIVDHFNCPESATGNFEEYIINPRWPTRFPSAHLTAQRYDMYMFEELEFRYFPTNATTISPGIIFMGWEPNANRGPPNTVAQINAFEHFTQGPVYGQGIRLRIPRAALSCMRYCRSSPVATDLNIYDTGRLIVGGDRSAPGASVGGYIEVYYRIRFSQYHLEDLSPYQSRMALLAPESSAETYPVPDSTKTTLPTVLKECFSPRGCIKPAGVGKWILPIGKYLVNAAVNYIGGNTNLLQTTTRLLLDGAQVPNLYSHFHDATSQTVRRTDGLNGLLTVDKESTVELESEIRTSDSTDAEAQSYQVSFLAL